MRIKTILLASLASGMMFSCETVEKAKSSEVEETGIALPDFIKKFDNTGEFAYPVDKFGDIEVIRYKIPSWEKLII
jgi:hypothetical protein